MATRMTNPDQIAIVIPAYQPAAVLVLLVRQIVARLECPVVVVDDGSNADAAPIFDEIRGLPRTVVLRHAVNLGKGQALKTAFNHVLTSMPGVTGVVTADADGQHLVEDIARVVEHARRHPRALVLGTRVFHEDVPLRSRLGNIVTRYVFRFLVGRAVSDTQTGLRGVPGSFLPDLLRLTSTGYEFELDMLVKASELGMAMEECPISTVYEHGNPTSHFSPFRDSVKIYFVFVRFTALSIGTAALDFAVFTIAFTASRQTLLSIMAARLIAGTFNFHMARTRVFRSSRAAPPEAAKFAALVCLLMTVSYGLIKTMVVFLGINVYLAKALAEGSLFFASFTIQQTAIFGQQAPASAEKTAAS
jgi:glycosyltransferase involved in cell wall biosynthesis